VKRAFAAMLCAAPAFAHAAEYTSEGMLWARTEAISNYALTVPASNPAYRLTLAADGRFDARSEDWAADGSLGVATYQSNAAALENTDYSAGLGGSRRFEHDTFKLRANYRRDSTLASELQTTGIVLDRVQRGSAGVTAGWQHAWNERLSFSVDGSAGWTHYFAQPGSGLVDFKSTSATVGVSYLYDERTSIGMSAGETRFDTDPFTSRSRIRSVQLTLTRNLNERWSVAASYGPASTRTETAAAAIVCPAPIELCQSGLVPFIVSPTTAVQTANGTLYTFTATYAASPSTLLALQASRSTNPSGAGTVVVNERVGATLATRLKERLTLGLAATAIESVTLVNTGAPRTRFAEASGNLTWQAAERMYLDGGLRWDVAEYASGVRPNSATVYLSLRYNARLGALHRRRRLSRERKTREII
jgi:hypothetical protein